MTWSPRLADVAFGTVVLLAANAAAQLPTAAQRAFDAIDRAIAAFGSASDREAMTRAAGRILDAAENARNAFAGPASARDAAKARASRALATAAERLTDNYYPNTRATEVTREAEALDRAAAAAAPEVSEGSDRTDEALEELIFDARNTFVVLESHVQLVEQAARGYERDPDPQEPDPLPGRLPRRAEPADEFDFDGLGDLGRPGRRGRRAGRGRSRGSRGRFQRLVQA